MADNRIRFEDFSDEVIAEIKEKVIKALHEAAGELEAQARRNSRVDTGQLKSSWSYKVDKNKYEAYVGSPLENAIWEEFGTGEYAVNGDGRKGGWKYKDIKGKWYFIRGKTPNRTLERAVQTKRNTIKKIMERNLKG